MSLETIAAGMFALKGLSLVTRAIRGDQTQGVSATEFDALLDKLFKGVEAKRGSDPEELKSLLFQALDADESGTLEGQEVATMQRVLSRVQRAAAEGAAASV